MSLFYRAMTAGLLTAITGLLLLLSIERLGFDPEESIGLTILFKLRGTREVPSDVVIVTLDKLSADNLHLPTDPRKWPRSLHAKLTEILRKQGAAVIAFDIMFDEAHSVEDDNSFAEAINGAGNVVLCERLKRETVSLTDQGGVHKGVLNIERIVPPIRPIVQSAVAAAPFPLPKVPVKVSQYWTFKTAAGDTPTLPVVAYQIFALRVFDEFMGLLEKFGLFQDDSPFNRQDEKKQTKTIEKLVRNMRDIFTKQPLIAKKMLESLQDTRALPVDIGKKQILKSLIKMYQSPHSQYLNYYGPPGTVPTLPYYQVLQSEKESVVYRKNIDMKAKAVFVGLSERLRPEQKDGFYTVYSQPSGLDISGVEIAATAFANLLEDMPVRRLLSHNEFALILLWGLVMGVFCRVFPTGISALCVIGFGALYLIIAQYQFKTTGSWYPIVLPLFIQAPLAFFGSVFWKYSESYQDRQRIRKAIGYYLPKKVVDQLAKDIGDFGAGGQVVYGTCLITDAGQYTSLSETMDPKKLNDFMHEYYQTLFSPVKDYGGTVINVVGDSMLALWATSRPDVASRSRASFAALNIAGAVDRFNQSYETLHLPTRIGIHSGQILLGSVGAIDHYEYRPTGDIVNTASRLEGLNKYVGTEIIISQEVLDKLDGLLTRGLGTFLLAGKAKPTIVYELIGSKDDSSERLGHLCAIFAEGLNAYRRQSWDEAIELFQETKRIHENDGPSAFYLNLCEQYRESPPGATWDGIVCLNEK